MGRYLPWILITVLAGAFSAVFAVAQINGKRNAVLDQEKLRQYPAKVTAIVNAAPCKGRGSCERTKLLVFDGASAHLTYLEGRIKLDNGSDAKPGDSVTVWSIPPTFFQAYRSNEAPLERQASTWVMWLLPLVNTLGLVGLFAVFARHESRQ